MAAIAEDLVRWFREAAVDGLVIPLGLGHPDHRMAADAGLMLAESEHPECVYVYEELPYAVEDAGDVACRKELLAQRGFSLAEDGALEFSTTGRSRRRCFAVTHRSGGSFAGVPERPSVRRSVYGSLSDP